jgi:hypothetical protein
MNSAHAIQREKEKTGDEERFLTSAADAFAGANAEEKDVGPLRSE